jgi:hypothetical protein
VSQARQYAALLERIADDQRRVGSQLQPPCTQDEMQRLVEHARATLRTELPAEYLDFLRLANGLDWNGVVVYASDTVPIVGHPDRSIAGVVEMNLNFRDASVFQSLIVLGSDGMDVYTYNVGDRVYEQYDEVPHVLIESFATFDELMAKVLLRAL